MEPPTHPLDPDDLLRHAGFLERLARGLARDEHESADLVQQAWAAALTAPPRAAERPEGLRAWLARVVRTRASNARRERERRHDRERAVARPEAAAADVEGELELQARVVAAVRALREPYRTTIHLRYFRDLPAREIAARLGVPISTVETRLGRGRAALRRALERELGDRRGRLGALLPLSDLDGWLRGAAARALEWTGAWIVGTKAKIASVLVGSVALLAAWRWQAAVEPPAARPPLAAEVSAAELVAPPELEQDVPVQLAVEATAAERSRVVPAVAQEPAAAAEEAPVAAARRLRGLVIDDAGRALPGVRVRFEPGADSPQAVASSVVTDARGAFELLGVDGGGQVRSDEPGFVTVLAGTCEGDGHDPDTVVVAVPAGWIGASVQDEEGAAIGGVAVELELPEDFRSRFEQPVEHSSDVSFRAVTDEAGRAALGQAPLVSGAALVATCDGYRPARARVDEATLAEAREGHPVELVLEHMAREDDVLAGLVVDEYGDPLPGVAVIYRQLETSSDDEGRFYLDLAKVNRGLAWFGEPGAEDDLVALRPGYLPGVLRPDIDARTGVPIWPDPVVLQPAGRALSIAGKVVDERGEPLAGYAVFLRQAHLGADGRTLEATLADDPERGFFYSVRSDAAGGFELGGLLDRDYDLGAIQTETLFRGDLDDVAAGTRDAEIRVDTRRRWTRVRGRVVDRDGVPVPDVVVEPYALTQTASGGNGVWSSSEDGPSGATDAEGVFTLHDLPFDVGLSVQHPDIMHSADVPFPPEGAFEREALEGLEIVVAWRLRFQVLLADPATADRIRVLDAEGAELDLYTQTANSYLIRNDNADLVEGRSRHLFVEQGARTLVLLHEGLEVTRVTLELRPGEELQVRL